MTQQEIEKFTTTLLVKAVDSGWNSERFEDVIEYINESKECNAAVEINYQPHTFSFHLVSYDPIMCSLDALISHHEEGEISFVEALCKFFSKDEYQTYSELGFLENGIPVERADESMEFGYSDYNCSTTIRLMWNLKTTSTRLDWFLGVFKLLL